jgi:hypothetical protein
VPVLKRTNVAVPSGDLYPNGLPVIPARPDVQATVRPVGWFFRPSLGFQTVRPGAHRLQPAHHGGGIHFTPHRFAEDIGQYAGPGGLPLMVDKATAVHHADIADLPGSDRLDDEGKLTADAVHANEGPYMAEGTDAPRAGDIPHESIRTLADMGDRLPGRPITRAFHGYLRNPADAFREDYAANPLVAVAVAGGIVGIGYVLVRDFERQYRSRRGRGVAAGAAAAPAAAVAASGGTVAEAAKVANEAATAAGDAAAAAASAAGDVAEAAGDAAAAVTDAAADAVTKD